jgi:hypothetical protein
MSELHLCEGCQRHVKATESSCPFCAHATARPAAPRSALAMVFAVAAAATVAACYGGPRRADIESQPPSSQGGESTPNGASDADGGTITQGSIGSARMLVDGTLELQLRAEDGRGAVGEGLFRYGTTHPQYAQVLAHVGPIQPGEERAVRPF